MMAYLEIAFTGVYPDRIERVVDGSKDFVDGVWHYDIAVLSSDMSVEDAQKALREGRVFRLEVEDE